MVLKYRTVATEIDIKSHNTNKENGMKMGSQKIHKKS